MPAHVEQNAISYFVKWQLEVRCHFTIPYNISSFFEMHCLFVQFLLKIWLRYRLNFTFFEILPIKKWDVFQVFKKFITCSYEMAVLKICNAFQILMQCHLQLRWHFVKWAMAFQIIWAGISWYLKCISILSELPS